MTFFSKHQNECLHTDDTIVSTSDVGTTVQQTNENLQQQKPSKSKLCDLDDFLNLIWFFYSDSSLSYKDVWARD